MKHHDSQNDSIDQIFKERHAGKPMWKRALGLFLRYGLPLVFSTLMILYVFHEVDFDKMKENLKGMNYWWIIAAMIFSILPQVSRAARWRLQLKALGINPPFLALCCSIFGTYALNILFPRLGELWRCQYIASIEKASFTKVFGSMMADRLSDTITVAIIMAFTFLVASSALVAFMTRYEVGKSILEMLVNPGFWAVIAGAAVVVWLVLWFFRDTRAIKRIKDFVAKMWNGFAVVGKMKGKGTFLALTLAIWAGYFFQLYIAFFAYKPVRDLCFQDGTFFGLIPCLVAFVISSIAMAIPSNGGAGFWSVAAAWGLAIYGIGYDDGLSFASVVWSAETIMIVILGIFTMVYISRSKRKKEVA